VKASNGVPSANMMPNPVIISPLPNVSIIDRLQSLDCSLHKLGREILLKFDVFSSQFSAVIVIRIG
jgi:hypothetical protein